MDGKAESQLKLFVKRTISSSIIMKELLIFFAVSHHKFFSTSKDLFNEKLIA